MSGVTSNMQSPSVSSNVVGKKGWAMKLKFSSKLKFRGEVQLPLLPPSTMPLSIQHHSVMYAFVLVMKITGSVKYHRDTITELLIVGQDSASCLLCHFHAEIL